MTSCEAGILRTLAFFDAFDYAPTLFELYRWQLKTDRVYRVNEIQNALVTLGGHIISSHGVYSLAGKDIEERVHKKRLRALYGVRKNKKALRFVKYFARFVYGIKGIAICNTRLPFLYANNDSDIDLFILTKKGRIWSVRFLLASCLKVLRQRPEEIVADAFDLSFYITDQKLSLEHIADIHPIYIASWIASIDPIYGKDDAWDAFARENIWITDYFPAYARATRVKQWYISTWPLPFLTIVESVARAWQKKHFAKRIAERMNTSTSVIVNDDMLKFHTNDRRLSYLDQYQKTCSYLCISP